LLLGVLFYSINVFQVHADRWDDAFITFRYAEHLAQGEGFVWNLGGDPTEGFTSLLHVLVLAGGIVVGVDPVTFALLVSLAAVGATVLLAVLVQRVWFGYFHPAAAAVLGFYLIDDITAVHTTSGLETQVFVALLAGLTLAASVFAKSPRWGSATWIALCIFLAVLCRPEGVLYGTATLVALAFTAGSTTDQYRPATSALAMLAYSAAILVILGSAYAAWKVSYYGYLFPNPYYVKSGSLSLAGWRDVARYVVHLGQRMGPLFLLLLVAGLQARQRQGRLADRAAHTLRWLVGVIAHGAATCPLALMLAPSVVALAYYATITHEVGGAYRFSYPTYFSIAMALAVAATLVVTQIRLARLQSQILVAAVAALFAGTVVLQRSYEMVAEPQGAFAEYHQTIATALGSTGLGGRATVICDAAGVIPYLSGFSHVDRVGLTDNFLSGRGAPSPRERESYLWSRRADVYVGYEPPASVDDGSASTDPAMRTAYVSQILLEAAVTRTVIGRRVFAQDPELLSLRMRELRDNWRLIGEISWPGQQVWGLRSFVYVWNESPYLSVLAPALEAIVDIQPADIELDIP
jgi:arabinofuranosyltransferase